MPKYEVSFTVETEIPLDEWCNENYPGSSYSFYHSGGSSCYSIPTTAVVKRVVPPFEYGYWRHKGTGAVYKIVENRVLRGFVERSPDSWERVSVEALADE